MKYPDNWVILKINNGNETFYKVLAGWSGGYTHGDSWRINSGITKIIDEGAVYIIEGVSGSTYYCRRNSETFTANTVVIYNKLKEAYWDGIELVEIQSILPEFCS